MTKGNWYKIDVGSRVTTTTTCFNRDGDQLFPYKLTLNGTVIRVNSNRSQVLVKWDDRNSENWYGRLGIEML